MIHNFHDISCLKDPEIEPDSYFDIHPLVSLEAKDKIRDNTYFLISLCITNFKEAVYGLNGKKWKKIWSFHLHRTLRSNPHMQK